MRLLIYIVIALFVAFQANAQEKKTNSVTPEKSQTDTQEVYPLGTESAAEAEAVNVVIEPDVYAVINGGPTDFLIYVDRNMQYPETAVADGVEGKVMVIATIAPDGRVIDAQIQNGIRDDINQEALRLVRNMPAWHPAQLGGKPVATKAVVMVPFVLEKNPELFK